MKKILTIIISIFLCLSFTACSNELPKGHANQIRYEVPINNNIYSDSIEVLNDVDFEYVNSNTIKITLKNGTIMYIDSSRIIHIKIDK